MKVLNIGFEDKKNPTGLRKKVTNYIFMLNKHLDLFQTVEINSTCVVVHNSLKRLKMEMGLLEQYKPKIQANMSDDFILALRKQIKAVSQAFNEYAIALNLEVYTYNAYWIEIGNRLELTPMELSDHFTFTVNRIKQNFRNIAYIADCKTGNYIATITESLNENIAFLKDSLDITTPTVKVLFKQLDLYQYLFSCLKNRLKKELQRKEVTLNPNISKTVNNNIKRLELLEAKYI